MEKAEVNRFNRLYHRQNPEAALSGIFADHLTEAMATAQLKTGGMRY